MNYRNLYTRLRLGSAATQDEIKTAYYSLSKLFHPDVNPGDNAAANNFRQITEAYQVLNSPKSRAAYDKGNMVAAVFLVSSAASASRFSCIKKAFSSEFPFLSIAAFLPKRLQRPDPSKFKVPKPHRYESSYADEPDDLHDFRLQQRIKNYKALFLQKPL